MPDWPLGLSSYVWTSPFVTSDSAHFVELAAMGYQHVEICVEHVDQVNAARVGSAAVSAGLTLSVSAVLGQARSLSSADEQVRADANAYIRGCIQLAASLGAVTVSGPLYGVPGGTPAASASERRLRLELATEELRDLAGFAAGSGISIAIEPLNRFETDLVNTVAQGLELCDAIGASNVGLVLDTFHMNIEEKNLPASVRSAKGRILEFQASESDRGIVGSGHVDWIGVLAALDEVGYVGPLIVESFRHDIRSIARAVSIWRPLAASPDELARESASFLSAMISVP